MSNPSIEAILRRPTKEELEKAILAVLSCSEGPLHTAPLLTRVRAKLPHIPSIYMFDVSTAGLNLSDEGKLYFTSTDGFSTTPLN
jgi:hypothetical protein